MSKNINLLPSKTKKASSHKRLLLIFRAAAIFSLAAVLLMSLSLFLIKMRSPLNNLMLEEQSLLSSFSKIHSKTAKYILVSERLDGASEIISQRPDFYKKIDSVLTEIPQGVSVSSISLEKKNVSFNISSSSLQSLGVLLERLVFLLDNNTLFGKVTVGGFNTDFTTGVYSASVKAEFL